MNLEDQLYKGIRLYQKIPSFLSVPLGYFYRNIPFSMRYGRLYREYKTLIAESEQWNDEKVEKFLISNLRETLTDAYRNTVYYKKLFDSAGFDPVSFNDLKEFRLIPFSDKTNLRSSKEEIRSRVINDRKLLYVTTGGTSGIPVEVFYLKGRERTREHVFITDLWKRAGYNYGDRIARLRGTVVDNRGKNAFFRHEPVKSRLYLSTYDLYEGNYPVYTDELHRFRPHFIHTYPSAITQYAKYVIENKIEFYGLKGLLCSSEQFYPGQRELIEKAFNCRIFSWYGHTESTTLAGECECSDFYHIYFQYGYTELIDEGGMPVKEPGRRGEITGTSFEMKAFPIIRYRTGDFAEWVNGKCSCGRNYRLITNVTGRWHQEQIITKKDSFISLTAINMHSDIFNNVVQYQFYQKEKGKVILRIIRSGKFAESDERKIITAFSEKFKDLVDFSIQYVNQIERTERGKQRFLISEINQV